jgi:hypothetical protein
MRAKENKKVLQGGAKANYFVRKFCKDETKVRRTTRKRKELICRIKLNWRDVAQHYSRPTRKRIGAV